MAAGWDSVEELELVTLHCKGNTTGGCTKLTAVLDHFMSCSKHTHTKVLNTSCTQVISQIRCSSCKPFCSYPHTLISRIGNQLSWNQITACS